MAIDTEHQPPSTAVTVAGKAWRILAGLLIAASFGVWVYAYSGYADRPPPDLFADPELAPQAEAICAAALAEVEALPSAPDAVDGPDRARQVRLATDRFEIMVDELAALPVTDPEDRIITEGWLADWRVLLADRRSYATEVEADPAATFYLSVVANNERLDRRLTRVATTNAMPSCATPTDVG